MARQKKLEKNWKICSFCKYIKRCTVGQGRIQDLANNPVAINDIGCFNYEIYFKGINGTQLNLFKQKILLDMTLCALQYIYTMKIEYWGVAKW